MSKSKRMKLMSYLGFVLLLLSAIIWSSCDNDNGIKDRNFDNLVWEDEFVGAAGNGPDPANWTYDLGGGGWGNEEFQSYTDGPENVSLDGNGNLAITARRDFGALTSARVKTQDLQEFQYGRIEARIKTPYGPGIWPAFWMLGSELDSIGWPQVGEIDIMELRGQIPNVIAGSVHGPGYSAGSAITTSYGLDNARFDTDFHIFAIEWGADFIDFFVDETLYQRITPKDVSGEWVFDDGPFFIILNVAVGGTYVGFPTADTPFPQSMLIDYVRVYQ